MRNQALRQFTIMLSMLALFGFGCKGSAPVASVQDAPPAPDARVADAPVSDAGPKIPEGWKVYENKAWAVSVAYPGAWHYRERTTEETGNQNELSRLVTFSTARRFVSVCPLFPLVHPYAMIAPRL